MFSVAAEATAQHPTNTLPDKYKNGTGKYLKLMQLSDLL